MHSRVSGNPATMIKIRIPESTLVERENVKVLIYIYWDKKTLHFLMAGSSQ